jgi:hypothetical protein
MRVPVTYGPYAYGLFWIADAVLLEVSRLKRGDLTAAERQNAIYYIRLWIKDAFQHAPKKERRMVAHILADAIARKRRNQL